MTLGGLERPTRDRRVLPICTPFWTHSTGGLCASLWGLGSFLRLVFLPFLFYGSCISSSCNHIHLHVIQAKLYIMLLQTVFMSSSCKLSSCKLFTYVSCNFFSCKLSLLFLQTVILQTVIAFLANCHLTFSFPALGCATQSHCSWCGGRSEELSFSQGSFQWAIFH